MLYKINKSMSNFVMEPVMLSRIEYEKLMEIKNNLDKIEEDANHIQLAKLAVEEENRSLRDLNFELQVSNYYSSVDTQLTVLC